MSVNGSMNSCSRCGKPVYFAERKTSLGKDWHPSCLRCEKCGKVLSPGQHAEHKGLPFCTPCYQSLYGPQMVGYGSNVFSAANYTKRTSQHNNNNNNNDKDYIIPPGDLPRSDLLDKLQEYNDELKGKTHCRLSVNRGETGETHIQGPLRIYWGLESPIQLKQCDEISPTPSPAPSWRHSHYPGGTNGTITPTKHELTTKSPAKLTISRGLDDSALLSPPVDTSNVVLRRKKGVRKFNTVAYRGDQGNRWKRASINGHVYNNDTRVFVPVIGSCTSVTVTSNMPTAVVIKTLLEKFKVENLPDEYSLYIVPDEGEPRLLHTSDIPLLERLQLGADEKLGKIFIKEKTIPDVPVEAWRTLTLDDPVIQESRVPEKVSLTPVMEISQEKRAEPLPEGLEQLVNLPLAVLQGLLQKFMNDEEHDVELVQKKYERAKYMVIKRMRERTSQA